jgi:hypothetical protein
MDYYILFNLNQWIRPSYYSYIRMKSVVETKIIYFQPNKSSE